MRLITNEELNVVAGGLFGDYQDEVNLDDLYNGWASSFEFDSFEFADGKAKGEKRTTDKREVDILIDKMLKSFPAGTLTCEAEAGSTENGGTYWKVKCTGTVTVGKK